MTSHRLSWPAEQPELTDGAVTLRAWRPVDASWVNSACQDPDIQRWTRVPVPYTADDAMQFVEAFAVEHWVSKAGAHFAIASAGSGEGLGSVGLVGVDPSNRVGELGYYVAPWARCRGVASQAIALMSSWALHDVGFGRLELHIDPDNIASRATAERAGYTLEGILRRKVLHRGERRDVAMYALVL